MADARGVASQSGSAGARLPRVMVVGPGLGGAGGIAVVMETLTASALAERYALILVSTHRDSGRAGKGLRALAGIARASWLLALRRIDVVYLQTSSGNSFRRKAAVAATARLMQRPYVVHVHAGDFDRYVEGARAWEQWLVRSTLTHAALVIALTPSWERRLRGLAPIRSTSIPNPVSIPAEPAQRHGSPARVVCLGRLGAAKGSNTLVQALARLDDRHGDVRLALAGDGDRDAVRREAERLGVAERVDLPGWIGPKERSDLLASASIFALPAREEGLPVSLLEAMAYGLPAIVSPVGGIPDVFEDGRHGYFVPPDDPAKLAELLELILDDPDRAQADGSECTRDRALALRRRRRRGSGRKRARESASARRKRRQRRPSGGQFDRLGQSPSWCWCAGAAAVPTLRPGMMISEVYRTLWRHRLLMLLTTALVVVAAFVLTERATKLYTASSLVRVQQDVRNAEEAFGALLTGERLARTYERIAETDAVGDLVKSELPRSVSDSAVVIDAAQLSNLELLELSVTNESPRVAAQVANAVPGALASFIERTGSFRDTITVVERASAPSEPSSPNLRLNLMLAFILGLILAAGLALIRESLSDRIEDIEELEKTTGHPVIAVIPNLKFQPVPTARPRGGAQVEELPVAVGAAKTVKVPKRTERERWSVRG